MYNTLPQGAIGCISPAQLHCCCCSLHHCCLDFLLIQYHQVAAILVVSLAILTSTSPSELFSKRYNNYYTKVDTSTVYIHARLAEQNEFLAQLVELNNKTASGSVPLNAPFWSRKVCFSSAYDIN